MGVSGMVVAVMGGVRKRGGRGQLKVGGGRGGRNMEMSATDG